MVGRGVCPTTAKGRSGSIAIADVFCSTTRGASTMDDRGKGEGVAGTCSRGGGRGEFLLMISPTKLSWIW